MQNPAWDPNPQPHSEPKGPCGMRRVHHVRLQLRGAPSALLGQGGKWWQWWQQWLNCQDPLVLPAFPPFFIRCDTLIRRNSCGASSGILHLYLYLYMLYLYLCLCVVQLPCLWLPLTGKTKMMIMMLPQSIPLPLFTISFWLRALAVHSPHSPIRKPRLYLSINRP